MITKKYQSKEEWMADRAGKITGSRLKDIVVKRGTGKKLGYYELIAERIAVTQEEEEAPMERGQRLEPEAIERFQKETGKKVNNDLIIWQREDNPSIAVSPDGFIGKTEAVEVKCLSSARHIEAWLTNQIPDEYEFQVLQYFIVNDSLKTLYVVFYDPRISCKEYFVIKVDRSSVEEKVKEYLEYQMNVLEEVNKIVNELTF